MLYDRDFLNNKKEEVDLSKYAPSSKAIVQSAFL